MYFTLYEYRVLSFSYRKHTFPSEGVEEHHQPLRIRLDSILQWKRSKYISTQYTRIAAKLTITPQGRPIQF